MVNSFTFQESNRITARNILVEGNVHITCDISLVDYPDVPEIRKEWENIAETIICTGDLYIKTNNLNCRNAVVFAELDKWKKGKEEIMDPIDYSDLIVKNPETFKDNMSINNKYILFEANEIDLYGKIVSKGDITVYSTKVFNKVRNTKINKIKTNIKKEKFYG